MSADSLLRNGEIVQAILQILKELKWSNSEFFDILFVIKPCYFSLKIIRAFQIIERKL